MRTYCHRFETGKECGVTVITNQHQIPPISQSACGAFSSEEDNMHASTHCPLSPVLSQLITTIDAALAEAHDPRCQSQRVASVLAPFLGDPRLLLPPQCESDPTCYRQHILHVSESGHFSIVALVWRPDQITPIHDHVCWCVVGVHQGREKEVQYQLVQDTTTPYLLPTGVCYNTVGSVAALTPPGDIHHVANPGPDLAISIHVYGADIHRLGSSIRRRYDLPVQQMAQEQSAAPDPRLYA
jgi:predicted metal-dependent enzyme (double-stranded beta helix superfamily)